MTTSHPSPLRRWPWLRLAGLVLLALVVISFWKMALRYQAASELRAWGFWLGRKDVWKVAREDWHRLFQVETWNTSRYVEIGRESQSVRIRTLDTFVPVFRRLKIEWLVIHSHPDLENVSALKDVPSLKRLQLIGCTALQNLDGLNGLTALREIEVSYCPGLEDVRALHGLTSLEMVRLDNCTKLSAESVTALTWALPKTSILVSSPDPATHSSPSPEGH